MPKNVPPKVLEKKFNQFGSVWSCNTVDEQNRPLKFPMSLHSACLLQFDERLVVGFLVPSWTSSTYSSNNMPHPKMKSDKLCPPIVLASLLLSSVLFILLHLRGVVIHPFFIACHDSCKQTFPFFMIKLASCNVIIY